MLNTYRFRYNAEILPRQVELSTLGHRQNDDGVSIELFTFRPVIAATPAGSQPFAKLLGFTYSIRHHGGPVLLGGPKISDTFGRNGLSIWTNWEKTDY